MIKENELRVGGTYMLPSGYNRLPSGEVTLSAQEMAFIFEVGCFDEINPILLTEEWLIRFGFKKCGELYIKNQIEIWYNEPTKRFYHTEQNIGVNTNYVHQLQNLYFALTWEELESSADLK